MTTISTMDRATELLTTDAVRITQRSEHLVTARVRDVDGIYDVQLSRDTGTARVDCTCAPGGISRDDLCPHVAAVMRVTLNVLEGEGGDSDFV